MSFRTRNKDPSLLDLFKFSISALIPFGLFIAYNKLIIPYYLILPWFLALIFFIMWRLSVRNSSGSKSRAKNKKKQARIKRLR
jgi:hypothetical protein